MGWLCDRVVEAGTYAIADFVCPTEATRAAFGEAFIVWIDRIKQSRFADTNAMFEPPKRYDLRVGPEGSPNFWVEKVCANLLPTFNPQAPTALFLGRYQPFHDGHQRHRRVGPEQPQRRGHALDMGRKLFGGRALRKRRLRSSATPVIA